VAQALTRRVAPRLVVLAALIGVLVLTGMLAGTSRASAAVSTPSWVPINPQSRPPAKVAAAATYDPATRQFVLFGGLDSQFNPTNDTWLWGGASWTAAKTAAAPTPRFAASIAYDASTSQLILFGGADQNLTYFADTWTWNGSNWVQLHPATSPPAGGGPPWRMTRPPSRS